MADMRVKSFWGIVIAASLFGSGTNLLAQEPTFQTGETSPIEFKKEIPALSFWVGGGGNVSISDTNVIDTIAGGTVKTRLTFKEFISIESSLDFNRFAAQNVDSGFLDVAPFISEADGDLFSVPFLHMLLIHTPVWNNMSFYAGGGVGYQFNDADDFEVDVTALGAPLGTLEVEVDDALIGAAAGGFDLKLSDHFVLNFDVRYQFAEFEVEQTGVIAGVPVRITEEEEHFDTVVIRTSLLYRF